MRKLSFVFVIALTAALLVPSAPQSVAQHASQEVLGYISMSSWVADDSPVIALKYIGAQAYASVDVSSNDLEFFSGSTTGPTALTADDEIDYGRGGVCDSGSTVDSILDVSESDCDTYEELVEVINASENWRAELVGALPSDTVAAADVVDPNSANVKGLGTEFYGLVGDDSGFDEISLLLSPVSSKVDQDDPSAFWDNDYSAKQDVCDGKQVFLSYVSLTADVTGSVTLRVYSVDLGSPDYSEKEIYRNTASDDTLTNFDFSRIAIAADPGECLLVRVSGGTLVTGSISANGYYTVAP